MEGTPQNLGELRVGLAADRQLRWAATDLTGVVDEGRRRLDLSPVATVALGRCATAAALLMRLSAKNPTRLTVEARGDGPLRRVLAEVDASGAVRGLVGDPRIEAEPSAGPGLSIGSSLGKGLLKVTRDDPERGTYTSQVELVSGEIGKDVAHFLSQSEQRRSAVLLGVLAKPSGVGAAGGLIVEALPRATPGVVERLAENVEGVSSISRLLDAAGLKSTVEQVLETLDPELVESARMAYHCRCSRQKLLGHLVHLTAEQVAEISTPDGSLKAECAFCGAIYRYYAHEVGPEEAGATN